jgi:hypothetical protein
MELEQRTKEVWICMGHTTFARGNTPEHAYACYQRVCDDIGRDKGACTFALVVEYAYFKL